MDANVQIILIIGVVVIIALLLNLGRLKKLVFKAGEVKATVEMVDNSNASQRAENATTKPKAVVERIEQQGARDEINIKAKDVKASDIKQKGDDNKINVG